MSQAHSRTHSYSFLLVGMEIKLFLSADTEKETLEWIQLIKELVLPEPKLYPSVHAGDIYGEWKCIMLICDCFYNYISSIFAICTYGLLTKLVRSGWLDIGQVLFLRVYGPRIRLGP